MTVSPNLSMPFIDVGQSQKETTHNDALTTLDVLTQASVLDTVLTAPPVSPVDGQSWIVAASATGAWAGKATQIAAWFSGWKFFVPQEGWFAYDRALHRALYFDGTGWLVVPGTAGATFRAADGTVPLPGISFGSDTDTGLVRLGANDLGVVTNGVLRFRIDGAGVLRLVSGNLIMGAAGSGGVVLDTGYVILKSDDGGDRVRAGKAGIDNRILLDLYDNAGASSVTLRDSDGADVLKLDSNGNVDALGDFKRGGVKVLSARDTGWAATSGTASKGGFATGSATLPQVAQMVKALQDALTAHGIIGA